MPCRVRRRCFGCQAVHSRSPAVVAPGVSRPALHSTPTVSTPWRPTVPAGLTQVEAAKADGRWDAAYEGQRTAEVPPDLQRELERNAVAREFFATLDSANRYAIVYRLEEAKKQETRQRRLRKFIGMLERGEKVHG